MNLGRLIKQPERKLIGLEMASSDCTGNRADLLGYLLRGNLCVDSDSESGESSQVETKLRAD